ncbi:MAG: methyltransferase domain-containing protein [Patescibacteria group bacterium]|nr:methyltransferase domain-containing protein [Patescibacteria group bacterium]
MYKISGGSKLLDVELILKKTQLKQGQEVADLGCGKTGFFIFPMADIIGNYGIVYAVDILKTTLETIDRRIKLDNIKNIKTVWSNLEIFNATNIESGSLDAVLLVNTLYQSQKRVEILRESIRMLKIGGKLVIVDWNDSSIPIGPAPRERVHYENLITGAQKLGLLLEDEFVPGQCHYGVVFSKQ